MSLESLSDGSWTSANQRYAHLSYNEDVADECCAAVAIYSICGRCRKTGRFAIEQRLGLSRISDFDAIGAALDFRTNGEMRLYWITDGQRTVRVYL